MAIKRIYNITTWAVVITVLLIAGMLVGVRLFGYAPYAVLTPSMTPVYCVGDLIYVRSADFDDISVGDAITFVADETLTVVTHKVVSIDKEKQEFRTQGEANDAPDSAPVHYRNVIGVVVFSLPKLGYVSSYFSSESGRYVAGAIIAFLLLLLIVPEFFKFGKVKKAVPNFDDKAE